MIYLWYAIVTTYILGAAMVACLFSEYKNEFSLLKLFLIFLFSPVIIPVILFMILQWCVENTVLAPLHYDITLRHYEEDP
jgi:hypothetical protein